MREIPEDIMEAAYDCARGIYLNVDDVGAAYLTKDDIEEIANYILDERNSHASLTAERDRLREENERLRNCLETITGIHGTNPSLPYADAPEADYLKHVLWEVRQLAREALKGDE